jgi:hypothetical protein
MPLTNRFQVTDGSIVKHVMEELQVAQRTPHSGAFQTLFCFQERTGLRFSQVCNCGVSFVV